MTAVEFIELLDWLARQVAVGKPHVIDAHRGVRRPKRFKLSQQARQFLGV